MFVWKWILKSHRRLAIKCVENIGDYNMRDYMYMFHVWPLWPRNVVYPSKTIGERDVDGATGQASSEGAANSSKAPREEPLRLGYGG